MKYEFGLQAFVASGKREIDKNTFEEILEKWIHQNEYKRPANRWVKERCLHVPGYVLQITDTYKTNKNV